MKSKFVCQRCGVSVGRWAKESTTIWKHQANMHNPSCGKPPLPVEREGYERDMRAFVDGALSAVEEMRTGPVAAREPQKQPCPACGGFGYHEGPDEAECDICEGNGMATPSAIRYYLDKRNG